MDGWMDEQSDVYTDRQMYKWLDRQMKVQTNGWIDGQTIIEKDG